MGTVRVVLRILLAGSLAVIIAACSKAASPATPAAPTTTTTPSASTVVLHRVTSVTDQVSQTVTLTNTGSTALAITSLVTSGNFAETDNCVGSVPAGASCALSVTFVPIAVSSGASSGNVVITDDAADSPQTLILTGPNVSSPADGVLSPTGLTFPSQMVGTTSGAQTVTLTNPRTACRRSWSSRAFATGDFAVAQNTCGRVLFSGRSCTIAVTFVATASGDRVGELTVFDNAAVLLQTVTLSGTGR